MKTIDLIKQAEQEVSQELESLKADLEQKMAEQDREWDESEKRLIKEYKDKETALEKQELPAPNDREEHRRLAETASQKKSFFVKKVLDELFNSEN